MSALDGTDTRPPAGGRARPMLQVLAWGLMAAATAALVAALSTAEALRLLGLPDPGPLTTYGLPAVTAFGEVASVVMVGSLLLAAVLVPSQPSGVLDVDGYLGVRTAGAAAMIWAGCGAALVPLSLSDSSGQPLSVVFADPGPFLAAVGDIEVTRAWVWTAALGVVVAVGCRVTLRHKWTPVLLVLAVLALMPRALSGHSASGGSHDIATNSLALHLVAAAMWAGGLAALVLHLRRCGGHLDVAARRFSPIALAAFVVMAASGVINAAVRVPLSGLVTSTYGVLVLTKVAALVVVGVLGWRQRTVAVSALAADPGDRSAFTRLAVVETVVLVITVGIAVALGRTPPPSPQDRREPSAVEEILGYSLGGAPTGQRLALDWRFDLLFGTAALVLAAGYLLGVRRVHAGGRRWPPARTVSWVSGCVLLLVATSSGVGRFAPAVFSVHMGAVAVLAIFAPLALAAGAPLTLIRAAITDTGTDTDAAAAVPGPRQWLRDLQGSTLIRTLTHPAVVWVLFVGGFFVFYLGGLYNTVGGSHVAHVLANAYFLIAGYLLFWVGLGVDPTGRRPLSRRAGIALLATALGAYFAFAVILRTTSTVVAGQYYTSLRRGWFEDLAADQRLGAAVTVAAGLIALLVAGAVRARQGSTTGGR